MADDLFAMVSKFLGPLACVAVQVHQMVLFWVSGRCHYFIVGLLAPRCCISSINPSVRLGCVFTEPNQGEERTKGLLLCEWHVLYMQSIGQLFLLKDNASRRFSLGTTPSYCVVRLKLIFVKSLTRHRLLFFCSVSCSTCIVEINEGLEDCTVRSLDESSTLRDNPANYRLSCVTNMYDDVTVTVFPPIGASQWTR